MITIQQINKAKLELNILEQDHEYGDSFRIAYEWFDSQTITKTLMGEKEDKVDLRRLMSDWAGREISENDTKIAAYLHPKIKGEYPFYNINPRLIYPSAERLRNILDIIHPGP